MKVIRVLLVVLAIQLTKGRTWISEDDSRRYHKEKEEEEFGYEIFTPISSLSRRYMQASRKSSGDGLPDLSINGPEETLTTDEPQEKNIEPEAVTEQNLKAKAIPGAHIFERK